MERNVPKLRFKGFNDEWKQKKLKDISTYVNRTIAENETIENVLTISAGKGFLNQKDRFSQVIAGNSLKKYTVLYNNEFSYNRGNSKKYTYGCIYKLENYEKALVPNVYISFKINNGVEDYYKQLFVKKYLDRQLRQLISSSARMDGLLNINKEDFFNVHVPVPSLEEQERIANFLTKVDKIIEKQDEKVKNLEKYKKGMMQKIFSQEIRFKDENGEEYPEWEEKKVKDTMEYITDFVAAGSFADIRKNVSYKENIDYAQLIRTIDLKNKFENKEAVYVDEKAYKYLYKVNLNKACIILPNIGANIGEVYYVYPEMFRLKNNVLGPNAILIRSDITCNKFMYYIFNYKIFRKQLNSIVGASGQPKFNKTELKEMKFKIPSLQEQIKIANILSKVESIIEKENNKLKELKRWKRGLLQQMFV